MKNSLPIRAMPRRMAAAALVAVSLLGITACAASPTTDSSAPASALTTVEAGKFTCAMSGEYRPFNFYDDTNTLVGFDVDICSAVADELGLEAAPTTGAFNTLIAGLTSSRYDAIVGSMAVTDERKTQVDFSDPYYSTGAELFVAKDSSITDATDLQGAIGRAHV